ncbi:MAG: O-methyltransferase [Alicyclobacillus sp.]|nr:O-methyltransferase [Alicyclobacillus sp.]
MAQIREQGMPEISVPPEVGQFLTLLVRVSGAEQLLEVGTLGGYSAICLLRGTRHSRPSAHLTSLELKPEFASVAKANLAAAGYGDRVTIRVGPALDSLQALVEEGARFDFFLIDADKGNYIRYLEYAVQLANPGAVIVADNALRGGRVLRETDTAPSTVALRAFNHLAASHPRLDAMLLPLGDGLVVAQVLPGSEGGVRP